jgi:type III pantothenate kinase
MKLLAIDVGNTHIVFGVYDGRQLLQHWRIQTSVSRTSDEYGVLFRALLSGPEATDLGAAVLSCVVPTLTPIITELCRDYLHVEALIVGPGVKTGMPILYDKPQDVGADRIVNAIAGYERTRDTTIVVDFGTTTNFDYVTAKGEYVGGVICPGLVISSEALFARAAKLNRVELAKPPNVVGRNTVNAVQSGLVYGHAAMVDGLVERIQRENKVKAQVIATGGLANLLAPEMTTIDHVDEFLTLDGLRLIYERNL